MSNLLQRTFKLTNKFILKPVKFVTKGSFYLTGAYFVYWTIDNTLLNTTVNLIYTRNAKNEFLVKNNPNLNSPFVSTFYLPFLLWQMIVASRIEKPIPLQHDMELLELEGGDCMCVEWFGLDNYSENLPNANGQGKIDLDSLNLNQKIEAIGEPRNISIVLGNINGANGDTYSRHTVDAL